MDDKQNIDLNEVARFISNDFSRDGIHSLIPFYDAESMNEFKKFLTEKLAYLIDNNFDLLVNTLYRIDVSEEKLSELFAGNNRAYIPSKLAELIINRQIQKIELRKKYKRGQMPEISE